MDKYEDFELVGEGSFGRVFKGRPKNGPAGHFVALKLLPKVGQSESELHNLRRECKIQRTLDHDNIVKAAESFETVNELVLVTEFVDGGNLATLMSQYQNGLPVYTVKQITVDLMCALHYLHGMRVLHRDLKPQNVLIDKASGKAKLADFGFARNLGINTLVLTSIKGTPLYMAPELIEERPYDFKADLWSAGGILYEVATGKPPFATNSLFQLIKKIRYEQVSWPGGIKDSICVGFLQGLLEKDVKKRMNWQQILSHRYISELPRIMECAKLTTEFTKPLTESQELAKEIQRQDKAKKLPGGSQTLINIAQKYEEQKKKLEQMKFMSPQPFGHFKGRRYSDLPHYQQLFKPEVSRPQRRNSDVAVYDTTEDKQASSEKELFNNDEWSQFLDTQISETQKETQGIFNANDLALLLKPLQCSQASSEVLRKVATILALPFLREDKGQILDAYLDAKVLPNLLNGLKNAPDEKGAQILALILSRLVYGDDQRLLEQACDFLCTMDFSPIFKRLLGGQSDNKSSVLDILIKLCQHSAEFGTIIGPKIIDELENGVKTKDKCLIKVLLLIGILKSMIPGFLNTDFKMFLKELPNNNSDGCDDQVLTLCAKIC